MWRHSGLFKLTPVCKCGKRKIILIFQNAGGELPTATEKKRAQGLSLLALRVLSHLQWNLEALEEKYVHSLTISSVVFALLRSLVFSTCIGLD